MVTEGSLCNVGSALYRSTKSVTNRYGCTSSKKGSVNFFFFYPYQLSLFNRVRDYAPAKQRSYFGTVAASKPVSEPCP